MLKSTYYKVAHHGARRSDTEANMFELLKAISPKRAYISHGYPTTTSYFHPKCEVIDDLTKLGTIESGLDNTFVCGRDKTRNMGKLSRGKATPFMRHVESMTSPPRHRPVIIS